MANKNNLLFVLKVLLVSPILFIAGLLGAVQGLWLGITDWIRPKKSQIHSPPLKHDIPDEFKDLIPLAERIGIGDDVIRSEIESKLTETEKQLICEKLRGRTKALNQWIDTTNCADEAVPFMYLLEAVAEMGIWPDKDDDAIK